MIDLEEMLVQNPIIAAIRNEADLNKVIGCKALIVFVLYGNILNINEICQRLKNAGKIVFVHVDMIEGIKGDAKGIEYVKKFVDPFGIITTKTSNIKHATNLNLATIQRVFIIDSQSMQTGIGNINAAMPNAVEVMPGIASKIINIMERDVKLPIIAGGLIENHEDVIDSLSAGAVAISTSNEDLWNVE